jgi:transposase InsO family protein
MNSLAQLAVENQSVLLAYGPMGVILAWFMFRGEKLVGEIRSLAHRIDGLTRALLMDMVTRDSVGPATKDAARAEIAKIEARLPKI